MHLQRRVQGAFKSLTACKCKRGLLPGSGSWAPDLHQAHKCMRCPVGGVCEGGLYRPYAQAGWWSPEIRTARTPEKPNNQMTLSRGSSNQQADGNTSLDKGDSEVWETQGTEQSGSFVPCILGESCKGGNLQVTAACNDRYTGTACSQVCACARIYNAFAYVCWVQCAAKHYRFFGRCYDCPSSGKAVNITLIVLLVSVWLVINN